MFKDEQVFTRGRDEGSFQAEGITYNEKNLEYTISLEI